MTALDDLFNLHLRLTQDWRAPFVSRGNNTVEPTPAGRKWLAAWERYQKLYQDLERRQLDPRGDLRRRLGLPIGPEEGEEDPHDSPAA